MRKAKVSHIKFAFICTLMPFILDACPKCDFKCKEEDGLILHIGMNHGATEKFLKAEMGKKFTTKNISLRMDNSVICKVKVKSVLLIQSFGYFYSLMCSRLVVKTFNIT